MWDERYSDEEYVYGTTANDFLLENAYVIPKGKILSLAEGEGRNAVFLAQQGYDVTAVDSSLVGLQKAQQLAKDKGVKIQTVHADIMSFEIKPEYWDGVISIFCPLTELQRQQLYPKITVGLKRNGVYLAEAYTPEQLNFGTGGGHSASTMTTKSSVERDLTGLSFLKLQQIERQVLEGKFHTGMGSVLQVIAVKLGH